MTDKPFACSECNYKGKTKQDLDSHSNVHKKDDKDLFKCEVFQCNYTSRTLMALKRHDAKTHLNEPEIYQCHCCSKEFRRGYLLTNHLKKVHQFSLAPGHSRFIYIKDLDGYYRLQTKRVENIKEEEPMIIHSPEVVDDDYEIKYEIETITEGETKGTPINVKMKKVKRLKPLETPTFQLFTADESTEDSKTIYDFEIVKNYAKKPLK
jgi:hypothetical protein